MKILFLKEHFRDQTIFDNCQLLLYPVTEVEHYINVLLNQREGRKRHETFAHDLNYNTLKCTLLSDDQILSLALYEIEKKYHFSGDGIWSKQDDIKMDSRIPK